MVVHLVTVSWVLSIRRVLLVMPWVAVPPVRGWKRGEGDSAVGRVGGFSGVGVADGVVLGVCGQCPVPLVRLLARVC